MDADEATASFSEHLNTLNVELTIGSSYTVLYPIMVYRYPLRFDYLLHKSTLTPV
jgi:hypothetical protein